MRVYDFRSDTVTKPTPVMRRAMAEAEVGDDVYGEDPTINRLEARAAELLGKESALFVTSGTMGNLLAVLASCERGAEVIMGRQGHTFLHEAGGVSVLGGVSMHTVPNQADGSLALEDLQAALRDPSDFHEPVSRMVILENTQNACGGQALSPEYSDKVGAFARQNGLLLHIDGARIFNAAAALGVPAAELARSADSITFCLSKGLCCPVGSVLCGSRGMIAKARRLRKMLGGGMRQAGILAAAGLIALDTMIDRLEEDHRRARLLAEGLRTVPGLRIDKGTPYTNMVYLVLEPDVRADAAEIVSLLKERGVLIGDTGKRTFRLVTHHDIDDEALEVCVQEFSRVMRSL
ncbi:MAG: low-specificity L-threonine aldolase [Chloroflexi bacterium]|jgi:threonine aldolase|nr:low-specificity L-threonine aldolase [Anaerolineaceae bacterium]NLI45050.1 low-specificity L-threonine aldolase [Chloroflexota bacterium]HOE34506.1 low-specificity L-threonine aldolase [Anaerolineaceae bacterium]HOT25079.1 low-specificity L-threonine aldolase [Anaerolineaceae bacterium]HQH58084.1 low-specificity L-threonine aldolase [Anaerolineaceae bacterium]